MRVWLHAAAADHSCAGRQDRGVVGSPSLDPGKEKVHARVSAAYKDLLHLRQPREGLTKKVWDIPCHPRQGMGICL